jgi:uncharacterized protein (DUF1800 family)
MPQLDPYQPSAAQPWNARRVAHLYNRLGFGANLAQIKAGLLLTPSQLVDKLLNESAALPPVLEPVFANWEYSDHELDTPADANDSIGLKRNEMYRRWISEMMTPNLAVRARMASLLHNIMVTGVNEYQSPSYQFQYYKLLHKHAFGNYKSLALEMGKSAAMLVYLNGNISVAAEPNENYARELMELFTLGENQGYTQADIVEMARALTGWKCDEGNWVAPYFDATDWDSTQKTIFGQTGNYNYTQAHNLVFAFRKAQVSRFFPKKLYQQFIYQEINDEVWAGLAATFEANSWEIMPVLKQLFKSEHFFSDKILNIKIKSPLDALLQIANASGVQFADWTTGNTFFNDIAYWAYELGQEIFQPPNVAGWPGHHAWLNENTLTYRWTFAGYVVNNLGIEDTNREILRQLAVDLTGNSKNPYQITGALVDHFLQQDLEPIQLEAAIMAFKEGIPQNYFDDGSWDLGANEVPYQIQNLLYYLVRLPEFQLS